MVENVRQYRGKALSNITTQGTRRDYTPDNGIISSAFAGHRMNRRDNTFEDIVRTVQRCIEFNRNIKSP